MREPFGAERSARLVIGLSFAAVVGCGSTASPTPTASDGPLGLVGGSPSAVATSVPSAPVTPAPSLSQDEIRTLASKAYLAAVEPTNKADVELFKQYKNSTTLKALRTYCAKLATWSRKELLALEAITFPTDTTADAKALIRYEAAFDADVRNCARSTSIADWNQDYKTAQTASGHAEEAANLVRLDLHLPPVAP